MAFPSPASKTFIFGLHRCINEANDAGLLYEEWAAEYGPAFRVLGSFGASKVVIMNPKMLPHFLRGGCINMWARTLIRNLVSFPDASFEYGQLIMYREVCERVNFG